MVWKRPRTKVEIKVLKPRHKIGKEHRNGLVGATATQPRNDIHMLYLHPTDLTKSYDSTRSNVVMRWTVISQYQSTHGETAWNQDYQLAIPPTEKRKCPRKNETRKRKRKYREKSRGHVYTLHRMSREGFQEKGTLGIPRESNTWVQLPTWRRGKYQLCTWKKISGNDNSKFKGPEVTWNHEMQGGHFEWMKSLSISRDQLPRGWRAH